VIFLTFEELRRLARQTNWEKSRLLFLLLKKVLEIMEEEDFVNSYVRHLFNDENNDLEILVLTAKDKILTASYLYPEKKVRLRMQDLADLERLELTETEDSIMELSIAFSDGSVIELNNKENFDAEDRNFILGFARSLYNA
jgi:hypothetical protein